jgi:hypothetical protein
MIPMTPVDIMLLRMLIETATSQFVLWSSTLTEEEKQAKISNARVERNRLMEETAALHGE